MMVQNAPFLWGLGAGAVISAAGVLLLPLDPAGPGSPAAAAVTGWLTQNLGHSVWLFAAVLGLYVRHLTQLKRRLMAASGDIDQGPADLDAIVELDQLSDVWIHLFIGIGVIWTAIGMRAALQAALADPDGALADTAGSVLQKLVDGGILLALSTTILGGMGGYLMRLAKTLTVGALLHARYQAAEKRDLRRLLSRVARIEAALTPAEAPHILRSDAGSPISPEAR